MSFSRSWWCALVLAAGVVGCHHDTDRGANAPNAYLEPHTQPFPAEPEASGAATTEDSDDQTDEATAPDTVGSAAEQGSGSAIMSQREPPAGSGSGSAQAPRNPAPDPDVDMNDVD